MCKDWKTSNALRDVARKCLTEIKAELSAAPAGTKFDDISGPIITKHHSKVEPLFSRLQLIWQMGNISGAYGSEEGYR